MYKTNNMGLNRNLGNITEVITIVGSNALVGAGTDTGEKFQVNGTSRMAGGLKVGADATEWSILGFANGGAIWQKSNSASGGYNDRYLRLGNINNNGNPNYVLTIHDSTVGIGTTTPDAPLAFADVLGDKIKFNSNAGNSYKISLAAAVNGGDAMFKFNAGTSNGYEGEHAFYSGTTCKMFINSAGSVGIGTISPQAKLDVQGFLSLNQTTGANIGLQYSGTADWVFGENAGELTRSFNVYNYNTASVNLSINRTTGYVGVGIVNPSQRLHVNGVIKNSGVIFGGGSTTLNYYEEGSWTPELRGDSNSGTVGYAYRSGSYVRIGNYVFVRWGFKISSISGAFGTMQITGLPFAGANFGPYQEPNISVSTGLLATPDYAQRARVFVNSTSLVGRIANNVDTAWPISEFSGDEWVIGEIFYYV